MTPDHWVMISALVGPYLQKFGKDLFKKLLDKSEDAVLAPMYMRLLPNEKLQIANREFTASFMRELDAAIVLRTLNSPSYTEALSHFLCNPTVQDALRGPLDGESELDWALLQSVWGEIRTPDGTHLITLPDGFEWRRVGGTYRQAIQQQIPASPELRRVLLALARLAPAEHVLDIERYSRDLHTIYGYLPLGSMGADWTAFERSISLQKVYVAQRVKRALPPRLLTHDYLRRLTEGNRLLGAEGDIEVSRQRLQEYVQMDFSGVLTVVADPTVQHFVILGDPGLGKSTLLRYLALTSASKPGSPAALLLELRRVAAAQPGGNFLEYLETDGDRVCSLPKLPLSEYLTNNDSLVLFDGLDEAPDGRRPGIVQSIIRFSRDFPRAKVIVSTRIFGYHPGSNHSQMFNEAGFQHFTLQDFEQQEVYQFISQWHREVFDDNEERTYHEVRLRNAIEQSDAIRELSTNPLLLTLMAVLNRSGGMPLDRITLYERCAELLLEHWDLDKFPELREKSPSRHTMYALRPAQKTRILEHVADAIGNEPLGLAANLISEDKLASIVERELGHIGVQQPALVASDLIWMLRERNFMLGYVGDCQYSFVHRTFLEFFIARALNSRLGGQEALNVEAFRQLFRTLRLKQEWQEVLRLLCGLVLPVVAGLCIEALLEESEKEEGYKAVFLAAQCLREVRKPVFVRKARLACFQACHRLVSFDFPYYYDELGSEERRKVPRIREQAVRELARGWKDDPDTLLWLRERVTSDYDYAVRRAAVEELAQGWKDDSCTLPLLKECAAHDKVWWVRHQAVQVIARCWRHDLNTLPWLKEQSTSADSGVRLATVEEISRGWKDAPETKPFLLDRALADRDEKVRAAAVLELARGWKGEPGLLPLLKSHIERDEDFGADEREAVLQELVRGWKGDPEVLPWLKRRATCDEDGNLRDAAVWAVARVWRDSETLCWLRELTSNPDSFVRWAAATALVRWWREVPGTLSILKGIAVHDKAEDLRKAALRELAHGWKDRGDTLALLKERGEQDEDYSVRYVAVQEVARCWKDDPDTLEWLRERALVDKHASVRRWAALRELATGWRDEPDTVAWLKDRAANDEDWIVRQGAVQGLAAGWKAEPDTMRWLRDRVSDVDWAVRGAAVRELARSERIDTDTLSLLENRAAIDDDARVRKEGVRALARRYQGDAQMVLWLSVRATQDQDADTRLLAMEEAARGWKTDAHTLMLLTQCATHDLDERIREAAVRTLANDWRTGSDGLAALEDRSVSDKSWRVRAAAMSELKDKWRNDPNVTVFLAGLDWPQPPDSE